MTTTDPRPLGARVAEAALPTLIAVASAVAPWVLRPRLPDPMATHWGLDGRPDASMPFVVDAVLFAVLLALVAWLPLRLARDADRRTARTQVATANGVAVMLGAVRWLALDANAGAAEWRDADPLTPVMLAAVLVLGGLGAALGWWLGRGRPERPGRRRPAPHVERAPGESLVWHGTASSPLALVAPPVAVAGALVSWLALPAPGAGVTAAALLVVALATAATLTVRVTIGPGGLVVRLGVLGWPRTSVALVDVTTVEVEDVQPLAYGGWGFRVVPGARAVIVRRGEGLRVGRRGRADLIVTVDGADEAAGVLAALGSRDGA